MFQLGGRYRSVSYFRRLVTDLMHFGNAVPSVTIERHMNLSRLVAARQSCRPPPTWTAIFTKAFSIVSADTPALRTSYMKFPWPRFYESSDNVGTLNIDRQLANERIVLWAHVKNPQNHTLQELDGIIRSHQTEPVKSLLTYRRAVRLSRFPWPLRRLIWWGGLNVFGTVRCHNYGTFGISSVSALGAGLLRMISLLTAQLHYGMLDEAGRLQMRLTFDHRVMDGATASKVLADLEEVLLSVIVQECAKRNDGFDGWLRIRAA